MTDIEILERANDYVGIHYANGVEDAYISPCLLKAIKNGIAALREQEERENPKPLTLDELRQMDGQPVYIVDLCQHGGFTTGWTVFSSHDICGFQIKSSNKMLSAYGYGERWLAYRSKPKE